MTIYHSKPMITTINDFDELTEWRGCEDDEFMVEYILMDNFGASLRSSPFLMSVGATFEHEFGTYKVLSIEMRQKYTVVICNRISNNRFKFDLINRLRKIFN